MFAPGMGLAFSSSITITTTMAAWIATFVTTDWINYKSAISVLFLLLSASTAVTMSVLLTLLLLTPSNVISLKCNNNAVVA